jgi:hypothetical protein
MFKTYISVIKLYKISIEINRLILWGWSNLEFILGDSRGQLFSLDLLFALIPLVLVLGIVASDMDNIMYLVQDSVFRGSTDRVAADTLNALLETSGQPTTWEQTGNPTVAGLAKYNFNKGEAMEGTVSSAKLYLLKNSDIQNIIGNDYNFFLNVTSADNRVVYRYLGSYDSSASDIVRVERVALYEKLDVVSELKDATRDPGIPEVYSSPPDPFPTNKYFLDTYDYWVIVDNHGYDSTTVSINGNDVVDPHDFNGQNTRYINFTVSIDETILMNQTQMQNNTVVVRTPSNPGASIDVYIIQAPRGMPQDQITLENIIPQKCRVIFYLWTK